jgi:ornithine--oxo-acid transaminase
MAAGLAALRELEDARLLERARRLGELLLEQTRPLISEHAVVRDVRGLGLIWAIEFAEPPAGSRAWRLLQSVQNGIFSQLIVLPLFTHHRIVCQVAGHRLPIVKALPPLVLSEQDVHEFAEALDDVIRKVMRPVRVGTQALRAALAR